MRPIHHTMWNSAVASAIEAIPSATEPTMNHEPGTSMRASGSSAVARPRERNAVMVPNARTTVLQFMKNSSRPEVTIIGTPIHRLHAEMRRNDGGSWMSVPMKWGARIP